MDPRAPESLLDDALQLIHLYAVAACGRRQSRHFGASSLSHVGPRPSRRQVEAVAAVRAAERDRRVDYGYRRPSERRIGATSPSICL